MIAFLCALPLVARLAACAAPEVLAVGYVEGEYVHLAPVTAATLTEVAPRQGDRVDAGADRRPPGARRRRDRARRGRGRPRARPRPSSPTCARAAARRRSRVTEASLEAAQVRLREAERQAERQTALDRRGVVAEADLDTAIADRDTARTEVAELVAQLAVERLPARAQVVAAAESRLPRRRGGGARRRHGGWRSATSPRRSTAR